MSSNPLQNSLRIGVLGAARIAQGFVRDVALSSQVSVRSVASRSPERAQAFAAAHGVPHVADSYDALLADPGIDAVYIALTNDQHVPWSLRALAAGKHVLCEKPLALQASDVDRLQAAAQAAGCVLMEAFPYRFQPQTLALLQRVRSGQLGTLRHVSGEFGVPMNNPTDYRLDAQMGGGALWDVGVYPLSFIRALAGRMPSQVGATAHLVGGVDHGLAAWLQWPDGLSATLACRFDTAPHRHVLIVGSKGSLSCGFHNHVNESLAWIEVFDGYDSHREPVPEGKGFLLEAEAFAACVRGEAPHPDWPTWAETRDTTALVQALLNSAQSGGAVNLPLKP
jgi:D-xylose 1-dehydrogenase (NADP+, D-xylono-1,5-lactone-forming)